MVLARAIKEHERRNGRREGFADTPGDALAYKFYRDVRRPPTPASPCAARLAGPATLLLAQA